MPDHTYPVRFVTRVQRKPYGSSARMPFGKRAVSVTFDEATLSQVIKLAVKSRCSMAEQIRTFVEWGLEAES